MSETPLYCRIHFVIGVILGAGLSSLCIQNLLGGSSDIHKEPQGIRPRRDLHDDVIGKSRGNENPFGVYEVHNTGHRLKAESLSLSGQASDQYGSFHQSRPHPVDHFDVYSEASFLQDDSILKDLRARQLVHISVLSDDSTLPNYGTATMITWGAQAPAIQFLNGGHSENIKRQYNGPQTFQLPGRSRQLKTTKLHHHNGTCPKAKIAS